MFFVYKGERFKIFDAMIVNNKGEAGEILESDNSFVIATRDKAISVTKIQRQGKQIMNIGDLLRGFQFKTGDKI
jgi:methionyl-tRNA formyltransferase